MSIKEIAIINLLADCQLWGYFSALQTYCHTFRNGDKFNLHKHHSETLLIAELLFNRSTMGIKNCHIQTIRTQQAKWG